MLAQLCNLLDTHAEKEELFEVITHSEPDGRTHRYVISRPTRLAKSVHLSVVGFFGQRRPEVAPNHFEGIGEKILHEIPSYPDVLGYNNMQLDAMNFGNLVLLRDEMVKTAWLRGENHTRAVNLSPGYYTSARIYNGFLPRGVRAPHTMFLTCVKYYDFECTPVWRGIRMLNAMGEQAGA